MNWEQEIKKITKAAATDVFERRRKASGHDSAIGGERAFLRSKKSRWDFLRSEKTSVAAFFVIITLLFLPKISLAKENYFETPLNFIKQTAQDIQEKIGDFLGGDKLTKQGQIPEEFKKILEQAEQSIVGRLKNALWQGIKDFWRGSIKIIMAIAEYFINFIKNFLGKIFKDII